MRVRFIKSPSGSPHSLGYFQGDVAELNDVTANELIKAGIAESFESKVTIEENAVLIETKINSKPKKAIKR